VRVLDRPHLHSDVDCRACVLAYWTLVPDSTDHRQISCI
jgi:hypothetical protein